MGIGFELQKMGIRLKSVASRFYHPLHENREHWKIYSLMSYLLNLFLGSLIFQSKLRQNVFVQVVVCVFCTLGAVVTIKETEVDEVRVGPFKRIRKLYLLRVDWVGMGLVG